MATDVDEVDTRSRPDGRAPALRGADLLLAAALAAATATAWLPADLQARVDVGRVPVTIAAGLGALFLVRSRVRGVWLASRAWLPWVLVGPVAVSVIGWIGVVRAGGRPGEALALFVAAFEEETACRVAIPLLVASLLVRRGVSGARALLAGVIVGGVVFVLLPGHVAQFDRGAHVVAFVAFAVLSAWIVWRGPGLLAAVAVHAASNLVTLAIVEGTVTPAGRALLLAGAMLPLAAGALAVGPIARSAAARRPATAGG